MYILDILRSSYNLEHLIVLSVCESIEFGPLFGKKELNRFNLGFYDIVKKLALLCKDSFYRYYSVKKSAKSFGGSQNGYRSSLTWIPETREPIWTLFLAKMGTDSDE